jgi:hypothetical protein
MCYLHHMDQWMLMSTKYYQWMLSSSYGLVNVDINKILSVNVLSSSYGSVDVDVNKILSVNVNLHHMDQWMLISTKYYQWMLFSSYGLVNVDINKILSVDVDVNKILSVNVIFIIWISECWCQQNIVSECYLHHMDQWMLISIKYCQWMLMSTKYYQWMLSSSYGSVDVDVNKIWSVNVIFIIWISECWYQ